MPGWDTNPGHRAMYKEVVARTCRTCHAAYTFDPELKFDQALQFIGPSGIGGKLGAAGIRVCNQKIMPHAKVTHSLFWTSAGPHMPAQFQAFGEAFGTAVNGWEPTNPNAPKCGEFIPGGATPTSAYTLNIQPIWNNHCVNCHGDSVQLVPGFNLQTNSHGNLVNISSSQLNTMFRITPNNPATSYLLHKVNGTQGTVGGGGQRMPQGCAGNASLCLSASQVSAIEDWINAGAPPP